MKVKKKLGVVRRKNPSAPSIVQDDFNVAIDDALADLDAARGGDQRTLHTRAKFLRAVLTASQCEDDEPKVWS